MDRIKHFKLSLVQSTPDIIWGCSASSLQIHNYMVHQIVRSKHISTFSFAIQRHFWRTCSKRGCYRSFMSPIHKQKHHLKCNIIKMRMELDHKKKATQTWRVKSSPFRKYFQLSPPGGGSSADFSKIFQTLNDLLAFKLNQRDLKLPDGDQELSYPCFQHFPAWPHSSPNKLLSNSKADLRCQWRNSSPPLLSSLLLPCFIAVLQFLSTRPSQVD